MLVVPSFVDLLQVLAVGMTAPTQQTFVAVMIGWVLARRRTVTAILKAAPRTRRKRKGKEQPKHWSCFHRFFSQARWCLDAVGLALFHLASPLLGDTVFLVVDDTLARKRGKKIYGVGWHHDPMLKNLRAKTSWGHSWVVVGLVVHFPRFPKRAFCLPILFRLYLNKNSAPKCRRVYRTRPELALEMVQKLCRQRPGRPFHLLGDMAYGGRNLRDGLPGNCHLTSTLRLDSRLHAAVEPSPGQRGRRRKRGERLPTPAVMLEARARRMEVEIYGRRDRVRLVDTIAYTFHHPNQPLRVVVVESLVGHRGRQAFFSTQAEASAVEVLQWYSLRWTLEVAFQCAKGLLGFEEPPSWSRTSVQRTAPLALLLYGLIVYWFAKEGHREAVLPVQPWYPKKADFSFADMLATLRRQSMKQQLFSLPLAAQDRQKMLELLENTVALAV